MKTWTLLALLSLVAMPAFADPAADAKAQSEAFARAWNARDVKGVLALYADDARVIWSDEGEEAKGKAEIEKLLTNAMKSFPMDGRVVFKSQEAVPLGNGYIATVGSWEISFTNDAGKKQAVQIRSTEIIRKQGRKTLYVIDHASVGTPPNQPAAAATSRRSSSHVRAGHAGSSVLPLRVYL
jgi:uncharacterized protein (TIGR02246 family)